MFWDEVSSRFLPTPVPVFQGQGHSLELLVVLLDQDGIVKEDGLRLATCSQAAAPRGQSAARGGGRRGVLIQPQGSYRS